MVRDAQGRELLQSSDADLMRIPRDLPPGFHTSDRLRTYTETAVRGTLFVTTAEELGHRQAAVRRAVAALIWPLAALAPIALLGAWLSIRLTLRPVVAFRQAIEARGRGNLTPVGAEGLPDEIAPVAASVNALIERLRGALEAERSFTANSAHELRTPIAAALAQTQRLIAELPEGPAQARARSIAAALKRLSRLSEKLLQLAKAEGGGVLAETRTSLAPALRLVIADIDRQTDRGEDLAVSISPAGGPVSDLDPDAFAILARNLIENALKHGAPDAPVRVRLTDSLFEVSNRGPVVPPGQLARLARPFERGATQAEGAGLGLAIAAAICRGAGLTLDLASPVPDEADGFQGDGPFSRRARAPDGKLNANRQRLQQAVSLRREAWRAQQTAGTHRNEKANPSRRGSPSCRRRRRRGAGGRGSRSSDASSSRRARQRRSLFKRGAFAPLRRKVPRQRRGPQRSQGRR